MTIALVMLFREPFALRKACFHKIKSREMLSRSQTNLNTTDNNTELRAYWH
jgi:hypothetical protein